MTNYSNDKSENPLLLPLLAALVLILSVRFLWLPWYKQLQEIRQFNEQNSHLIAARTRSLVHSEDNLIYNINNLDSKWSGIQSLSYLAPSLNKITTELVENLHRITKESGINLISTNLLPTENFDSYLKVGAEIRATGSDLNVLRFLDKLNHYIPMHYIEVIQIDVRQGLLYLDARIKALAFIADEIPQVMPEDYFPTKKIGREEQVNIFQEFSSYHISRDVYKNVIYVSHWDLVGLIYNSSKATALLKHNELGIEEFVQVGDFIGDEYVKEIGNSFVILEKDNNQVVLWSLP